jgi:hypothetical protein
MEENTLKNVKKCLNTNIYCNLETSGGISYKLYLNFVHFSTPVLIRHLWQLKAVVFQHRGLICTDLLMVWYKHQLTALLAGGDGNFVSCLLILTSMNNQQSAHINIYGQVQQLE